MVIRYWCKDWRCKEKLCTRTIMKVVSANKNNGKYKIRLPLECMPSSAWATGNKLMLGLRRRRLGLFMAVFRLHNPRDACSLRSRVACQSRTSWGPPRSLGWIVSHTHAELSVFRAIPTIINIITLMLYVRSRESQISPNEWSGGVLRSNWELVVTSR